MLVMCTHFCSSWTHHTEWKEQSWTCDGFQVKVSRDQAEAFQSLEVTLVCDEQPSSHGCYGQPAQKLPSELLRYVSIVVAMLHMRLSVNIHIFIDNACGRYTTIMIKGPKT